MRVNFSQLIGTSLQKFVTKDGRKIEIQLKSIGHGENTAATAATCGVDTGV
jgi:hypothetical protein